MLIQHRYMYKKDTNNLINTDKYTQIISRLSKFTESKFWGLIFNKAEVFSDQLTIDSIINN